MADAKQALRQRITDALTAAGVENPDEVIAEFKLLTAQEDSDPLRETARLVNEHIDNYAKMLEDFLQPDTHISAMNEISFFTEKELGEITKLYRAMMHLFRHYTRTTLLLTDEAHKEYLLTALKQWSVWKRQLLTLVRKLEQGWTSEQPLQTERSYFG